MLRTVAIATMVSFLIIAGMAFGIGQLTLVAGLVAVLVALVAPEVGLGILVTIAPLQTPASIPAPGLNFLLAGAVVLGCVFRLPIDRPRLRVAPSVLLIAAFVVYVTLQQLPEMLGGYAGDDGHAVGYLFFQVLTGLATIVAAGYVFQGRSPMPVLTMALVGIVLSMGIAVATFEAAAGPPLGNLVANADVGLRAAGPFGNPNYMGTLAAIGLVVAIGLRSATTSRLTKTVLLGLAILSLVALVQSQSRGAMVAGFAGLAALSWFRNRALTFAILASGLIAAVLIYPAFVEWRLTNLRGTVSDAGYVAMTESDDARLGGALAGPAMFLSEPVFGVGFGQFVTKSVEISGLETGINAHNWYINVLAEQGTIGGALWFGACVAVVRQLWTRRGVEQRIGFAVFTTLAVGFLFLEGPESFQTIAIPLVALIASLTADWHSGDEVGGRLAGARVERSARVSPPARVGPVAG